MPQLRREVTCRRADLAQSECSTRQSTGIILATGEYVPPSVTLQSGVVGHLSKPFTTDAVRDALSDAMVWHQVASRNLQR